MQNQWNSKASKFVCDKTGLSDPAQAIRSIARSLLDDPPPVPTNLESVARRLNVEKVLQEPLPFDGVLVRRKDRLTIKLNTHIDPRRRRFTFAHELAHVLLTNGSVGSSRRSFRGTEVERLCDIAASELLMPEPPARDFFKTHGVSPSSVCEFAASFDVSMQAAARRVWDLQLSRGTLVLLKKERDDYFSLLWKVGPINLESPVLLPQLIEGSLETFTVERVLVCKLGSGTIELDLRVKRLGSSGSFLVLASPCAKGASWPGGIVKGSTPAL